MVDKKYLDELDLSEYDKYLADSVKGYGHKWTYTETCNC